MGFSTLRNCFMFFFCSHWGSRSVESAHNTKTVSVYVLKSRGFLMFLHNLCHHYFPTLNKKNKPLLIWPKFYRRFNQLQKLLTVKKKVFFSTPIKNFFSHIINSNIERPRDGFECKKKWEIIVRKPGKSVNCE